IQERELEEQRRREERELEEKRLEKEIELEQKRLELEEQRRREEREEQRRREEREEQRKEREDERRREEREADRQFQLELARIQQQQHAPQVISDNTAPKLPAFVDGKDQIDSYLARFERFAESSNWQPQDWAIRLSALLTGQALEVYTRLSNNYAKKLRRLERGPIAVLQLYREGLP
ncbi:hypothetical protein, partial [Acinetobacter baumannii]|uniref:hypothetical protein n=1 Tax=Acinetobacter baumannii TaxID=470 RepID=UPI003391CB68